MARIGESQRGVMITQAAARRIAKVVHAFERDPRVVMKARPLRTAAGDEGESAIKLGKTTEKIDRLFAGSVAIYTSPPADETCRAGCFPLEFVTTGETICAQNLLTDLASGEWVYALNPSGTDTWHIIGRATPDIEEEEDSCGRSTINAVQLTFEACHGTGAKAHATVDGNCPGAIAGVVVDDPGSGYAIIGRSEPELIISGGGGSGATFTVTYTETAGDCDIPTWSIASVAVDGGENYRDGAVLTVRQEVGTVLVQCAKLILQTGSGGVPESVTVEEGGEFYKEDESAEPYVAEVTVNVTQTSPSAGSGAAFTATVDDDPSSETFGQITSVTVDEAGYGYIDQLYGSTSVWGGLDFTTIPGYNGAATQMLGHSAGGCLYWYNVTSCEPDTSGVCCDGGEISAETTQAACEDAAKTWVAGVGEDSLPGPCCDVGE